jgi:hypothetical protein
LGFAQAALNLKPPGRFLAVANDRIRRRQKVLIKMIGSDNRQDWSDLSGFEKCCYRPWFWTSEKAEERPRVLCISRAKLRQDRGSNRMKRVKRCDGIRRTTESLGESQLFAIAK